jgi:hypothetical protein
MQNNCKLFFSVFENTYCILFRLLAKLCNATTAARVETTKKGIETPKETFENRMQSADNKTPKNPIEKTEMIFTNTDFFIIVIVYEGFNPR